MNDDTCLHCFHPADECMCDAIQLEAEEEQELDFSVNDYNQLEN